MPSMSGPTISPLHSMNETLVAVTSLYVRPCVVPVTAPEHPLVAPIAVAEPATKHSVSVIPL